MDIGKPVRFYPEKERQNNEREFEANPNTDPLPAFEPTKEPVPEKEKVGV